MTCMQATTDGLLFGLLIGYAVKFVNMMARSNIYNEPAIHRPNIRSIILCNPYGTAVCLAAFWAFKFYGHTSQQTPHQMDESERNGQTDGETPENKRSFTVRESQTKTSSSRNLQGWRANSSKSLLRKTSRASSRDLTDVMSKFSREKGRNWMGGMEEEAGLGQTAEAEVTSYLSKELSKISFGEFGLSHSLRKTYNLIDLQTGIVNNRVETNEDELEHRDYEHHHLNLNETDLSDSFGPGPSQETLQGHASSSRTENDVAGAAETVPAVTPGKRKKPFKGITVAHMHEKKQKKKIRTSFFNNFAKRTQTGDRPSAPCKPTKEDCKPYLDIEKAKLKAKNKKKRKKKKGTQIQPEEIQWGLIQNKKVSTNDDLALKSYFQSLLFYMVYLAFVTIIAIHIVDSNMYYYRQIMTSLFLDTPNVPDTANGTGAFASKTLRNARTIPDFWAFAQTTMIKMFHWNFYYPQIDTVENEKDDRKMFYDNQILGVPRLRQLRVASNSCTIHPLMLRFFNECYAYYSVYAEDVKPIRRDMRDKETATAWVYTEAEKLGSTSYWGDISIYGGGGYYLDMGRTENETVRMVAELKKYNWLSQGTRAVLIEFNMYNVNVNYFVMCKIAIEFPPFGGILVSYEIAPLKVVRYLRKPDFFFLGCEFLLLFFICYFVFDLVQTFKLRNISPMLAFWIFVDIVIILLAIIYVCLVIVLFVEATFILNDLTKNYYKHKSYDRILELQKIYQYDTAFLLFFSWLKLLSYLDFANVLLEFHSTLLQSILYMCTFLPVFLTILMAFAKMGFILFGTQVEDYSSLWKSAFTIMKIFGGTFEVQQIQLCSPIIAPIYYIALTVVCIFLMMCLFIAIVSEVYRTVKSSITIGTPLAQQYMKLGVYNFLKFFKQERLLGKKIVRYDVYESVKSSLKRAGFTDNEIEAFFEEYEIDPGNVHSQSKRNEILEKLEMNYYDITETAEQYELKQLSIRMDE
ncbi:hypothetical protein RUM43_005755 [Polyplax serrata]|uniref:Polycystic kidney disease 2-like 1 protein n=1 Tax=Polyplax serrata TaxID=468196 RepID=A0AAN8NQS5_POLSC